MLLHIVARGRIGRGPEADLVARYGGRLSWPFKVTELPDRGGKIPPLPTNSARILLDEHGDQLTSMQLAGLLGRWRDEGRRECRFEIGAADGFSAEERRAADRLIAFGRMTWPHMMARAMLAEQLWRATSILANHPYHREG
ncbi:MAG: 23S rRNA (pseudouridine(1915)-N(3))-methyltransferase RlmH [Sphingobium sp.]